MFLVFLECQEARARFPGYRNTRPYCFFFNRKKHNSFINKCLIQQMENINPLQLADIAIQLTIKASKTIHTLQTDVLDSSTNPKKTQPSTNRKEKSQNIPQIKIQRIIQHRKNHPSAFQKTSCQNRGAVHV